MNKTNRTQEEILARMKEREKEDFFGTERSDLLEYLDYNHAKPFLKETTTKEDWDEIYNKQTPREKMIEYMEFAWEKVNGFRGLSSARSMSHYTSWLWLDGDNELWKTLEDYNYYGKPQLVSICEYLGLDASEWDDGIRANSEEELE